jgi:uncharacterized protein (TIGR03435 family)
MIPAHASVAWPAIGPALINHLWQSTLVAAAIGILALALRKNPARLRYWLWLAASVKFLVPFSLLIALGGHVTLPGQSRAVRTEWQGVIEQIGQPFAPNAPTTATLRTVPTHSGSHLPALLFAAWACGIVAIVLVSWRRWSRIRNAICAASPSPLQVGVPVLSSSELLEPGVFGIFRPVLLLPEGIQRRMTAAQLEAIIAHELCHIRRRDNLAAAIHMVVEAVFWFHPLVWWLGARLVAERESACDEEVLRMGSEPEVYAESILKTCQFYLESPLVCMSGITGANLKARIVRIMTQGASERLSLGKKLLLASAAIAAVAGPIAFGIWSAPQIRAQTPATAQPGLKFEVASIKPSDPSNPRSFIRLAPGRYTAEGMRVHDLIANAYGHPLFQISGGPDWINTARYDIVAKADESEEDPAKMTSEQREASNERHKERLRALLVDRFQFQFHTSTKEMPVYALVVGNGGPKFQATKLGGDDRKVMMRIGPGQLTGNGVSMGQLASNLGNFVDREVVNETGLTERYDIKLECAPEQRNMALMGGPPPGAGPEGRDMPPPPDPNAPSIFTALQEQLGLKLESKKAPIEILVIDRVERPSEN